MASLSGILNDVDKYASVIAQVASAAVGAATQGTVAVILTAAGATAQLIPSAASPISAGIDITEEVASLISAIKGISAKATPAA